MSSTVERPPAVNVVAHASEYSPDRDTQGQGYERRNGKESDAQRQNDEFEVSEETPAVLYDADQHAETLLSGVAAYRDMARGVLDPVAHQQRQSTALQPPDKQAADTVRHAYEEHGGEIAHHEINVAT